MLIEFSISNFRSFRSKQTLSMVAAPRIQKSIAKFRPEVDEDFPDLLKAAVIYGPNASGKSNLTLAFEFVAAFSRATAQSGASILRNLIRPFAFDASLRDQASQFDIHFISERIRYNFVLQVDRQRVLRETLHRYPAGEEQLVYDRRFNGEIDEYAFGAVAEANEIVRDAWKKLTSPTVLFLAQAVANSSDDVGGLQPPMRWLRRMMTLNDDFDWETLSELSQEYAQKEDAAKSIARFLRDVDVPIQKIRAVKSDLTTKHHGPKPEGGKERYRLKFTHRSALGDAELDFNEESLGTQKLLAFWFPWQIRSTPSSESDHAVLVVDELDSSLHPLIVTSIVERHLRAKQNAQLIFTTHDTHLMESKLLRRDQIWATERDENGATLLRSFHEFEGRESEDIQKRYLEGRYRGLPIVGA